MTARSRAVNIASLESKDPNTLISEVLNAYKIKRDLICDMIRHNQITTMPQ